jgi:hypothetical protein
LLEPPAPTPNSGGYSICADAVYPLPVRCALPVRPGRILTINVTAPVQDIKLRLVRDIRGSSIRYLEWRRTKRNPNGQTRWRFRFPRKVDEAAVADVFVQAAEGDSNTWTGLATSACRESELPKP